MLPLLMVGALSLWWRFFGRKERSGRDARGGPGVSWRSAVRRAISVTSMITAGAVVTPMRDDMIRMVPADLPHPEVWVSATGSVQFVAGAGLAVPVLRPAAAGTLALLVAAKLPANVKATREGLSIRGPMPTPPWMRIPDTIVWLALLGWVGRERRPKESPRQGVGVRTPSEVG